MEFVKIIVANKIPENTFKNSFSDSIRRYFSLKDKSLPVLNDFKKIVSNLENIYKFVPLFAIVNREKVYELSFEADIETLLIHIEESLSSKNNTISLYLSIGKTNLEHILELELKQIGNQISYSITVASGLQEPVYISSYKNYMSTLYFWLSEGYDKYIKKEFDRFCEDIKDILSKSLGKIKISENDIHFFYVPINTEIKYMRNHKVKIIKPDKIDPHYFDEIFKHYWIPTSAINVGIYDVILLELQNNFPETICSTETNAEICIEPKSNIKVKYLDETGNVLPVEVVLEYRKKSMQL